MFDEDRSTYASPPSEPQKSHARERDPQHGLSAEKGVAQLNWARDERLRKLTSKPTSQATTNANATAHTFSPGHASSASKRTPQKVASGKKKASRMANTSYSSVTSSSKLLTTAVITAAAAVGAMMCGAVVGLGVAAATAAATVGVEVDSKTAVGVAVPLPSTAELITELRFTLRASSGTSGTTSSSVGCGVGGLCTTSVSDGGVSCGSGGRNTATQPTTRNTGQPPPDRTQLRPRRNQSTDVDPQPEPMLRAAEPPSAQATETQRRTSPHDNQPAAPAL